MSDELIDESSAPPKIVVDAELESLDAMARRLQLQLESAYNAIGPSTAISAGAFKARLAKLEAAEQKLRQTPLSFENLIAARRELLEVEAAPGPRLLFSLTKNALFTATLVYVFVGALFALCFYVYASFNGWDFRTDGLDDELIGVPAYVWIWSVIGSATAMLIRAGKLTDEGVASFIQWLLYRPLVGVSTGVLLYLVLQAGLTVLSAKSDSPEPQKELFYVLSFLGGFSDTLSVNMLERIMGQLSPTDTNSNRAAGE